MPPKNPQASYTKKPVRRLRLPKMGPVKTANFFEEYFYACVAVLFLAVALLLFAGGMSVYESAVIAAWVAGALWFGKQLKGYWGVKEKEKEAKAAADAAAAAAKAEEGANGNLKLPAGMKPMIGLKWPVKSGPFPNRPGLRAAPSVPSAQSTPDGSARGATGPATPASTPAAPGAAGNKNKPGFVYERPTLPDRKPKLPHNWRGQETKKPKR